MARGIRRGWRGEAIPIAGRIVALADVFDALGSRRSYKEPWPAEQIRQLLSEQRGQQFEPRLVDLLLEHFDEFLAIREQHPDDAQG